MNIAYCRSNGAVRRFGCFESKRSTPDRGVATTTAHGNKPRTCLALMTRSTPVAIAAVRCDTLCSFARLITCANECSRIRKSLSVTSDSDHKNACRPCTHSKYETMTPPALRSEEHTSELQSQSHISY